MRWLDIELCQACEPPHIIGRLMREVPLSTDGPYTLYELEDCEMSESGILGLAKRLSPSAEFTRLRAGRRGVNVLGRIVLWWWRLRYRMRRQRTSWLEREGDREREERKVKLTIEVAVNIGDRGAVARHRDEVTVGIGDATQMLADDLPSFVQIIRCFVEERVTPELDAGHAAALELFSAMKPGLSAAHAAASAKWKELLEGPK
jgi:hypothetical protein